MRRQTLGNSMIAGVFGIVLLAGCSTNPAPAVNSGMMTGKIKTAAPPDGCELGVEPSGVMNVTNQSPTGEKIYKVHITIYYPKFFQSWNLYFETPFNKTTPFQSVGIFASDIRKDWNGVRGCAKVERDGLHYQILMKDPGQPSHIVRGKVTGNQQEYLVSLNDEN